MRVLTTTTLCIMCLLMFAHLDAVCYWLSCFSFIRNGQDDFIAA